MGSDLNQAQPFLIEDCWGGKLLDKLQEALDEVVKDVTNPNKRLGDSRKVKLEIEIKPASDETGIVRYRATVDPVLAKSAKMAGIGRVDMRGNAPTLMMFPEAQPGKVLQLKLAETEGE